MGLLEREIVLQQVSIVDIMQLLFVVGHCLYCLFNKKFAVNFIESRNTGLMVLSFVDIDLFRQEVVVEFLFV